jgi:hypothetical protein
MDYAQMTSTKGQNLIQNTMGRLFHPQTCPVLHEIHLNRPKIVQEFALKGLVLTLDRGDKLPVSAGGFYIVLSKKLRVARCDG